MGSDLLLETYLKRLRLPTVAANYRRFAQEATQGNQPYERYLLALLETEVHHQEANSERKRIVQARFPVLKTLDEFQFAAIPALNRQAILELAQSNYIQAKENVVFLGPTGTGKPHMAVSLGLAACRQGQRVLPYDVDSWIVGVSGKRQGRVGDIIRINHRSYFKEAAVIRFPYITKQFHDLGKRTRNGWDASEYRKPIVCNHA